MLPTKSFELLICSLMIPFASIAKEVVAKQQQNLPGPWSFRLISAFACSIKPAGIFDIELIWWQRRALSERMPLAVRIRELFTKAVS
jgi:hypothetical protein